MQIKEIAENINDRAKNYKMKDFSQIRKKLHSNITRSPPGNIFTFHTIKDEYVFHHGGRKELQFNIGFIEENDEDLFRYGIALSLETSQTLPDYTILDKKFLRLNEFIKANRAKLKGYKLYYHGNKGRIFLPVDEINSEVFNEDNFIFLGKIAPMDKIDYDNVLSTFDDLLDAYLYVEGKGELTEIDTTTDEEFIFELKSSKRVENASRLPPANLVEVDLRHNQIQGKIRNILIEKFGEGTVGEENNTGFGTSIDLVAKYNSELIFYEIKTASSIRLCFREAIGQLIEYAYWSKKTKPTKLIIVSENPITDKARNYLQTLRNDLHLNIYYQQFDFDNNKLSQEY